MAQEQLAIWISPGWFDAEDTFHHFTDGGMVECTWGDMVHLGVEIRELGGLNPLTGHIRISAPMVQPAAIMGALEAMIRSLDIVYSERPTLIPLETQEEGGHYAT